MSSILKIRIPFFRRTTNNGNDGRVTLSLNEEPKYLPSINQKVLIIHTDVPENTQLNNKLNSLSTNTTPAIFVEPTSTISDNIDGFSNFMVLQYEDTSLSGVQGSGDCRGFIEYDVNPIEYTVLKPIEGEAVVVNEVIPFDLNDGFISVTNKVVGSSYPNNYLRGMFVKRKDTNTIFANLLKSLNLPVSDEEMKKYTRSDYGTLTLVTNGGVFDTTIGGERFRWDKHISTGATTDNLVVHPTTGFTGEYYGTALQSIGSYEYTPTNKAIKPIENELYLIFEIPSGTYGELIDGKTVKFGLPYYTGGTSNLVDAKLGIYNYTTGNPIELDMYGTYNKKNIKTTNLDRVLSEIDFSVKDIGIRPNLNTDDENYTYESNIVPLFSDNIKVPQGTNLSSWSSGYSDVIDGSRVFNELSQKKALYNYKIDECVGFVALDKGFIVITHPKIVDSYFKVIFNGEINKINPSSLLTSAKNYDVNGVLSTTTSRGFVLTDPTKMVTTTNSTNEIIWDSTQFVFSPTSGDTNFNINSDVQYISYNTEKSLNIVCLASADEFFKSTNDTAKELLNVPSNDDFANFKTENQNLYPINITQVGIHDAQGNLLAICKPTQPIKKYWFDVVSFNVRIRL
jgi:hypothetical protein